MNMMQEMKNDKGLTSWNVLEGDIQFEKQLIFIVIFIVMLTKKKLKT